jgi:hypothetical protein
MARLGPDLCRLAAVAVLFSAGTWLGQTEARGMEQGSATATRQAVERMRRVVLRQIEQRFGKVPTKVCQRIEAIDSLEPLAALAE